MPSQSGALLMRQSKAKQQAAPAAAGLGKQTAEQVRSRTPTPTTAGSTLALAPDLLQQQQPTKTSRRQQPRRSKSAGAADHAAAAAAAAQLLARQEPASTASTAVAAAFSRLAASVFGPGRHHGLTTTDTAGSSKAERPNGLSVHASAATGADQIGLSVYESIGDCSSNYDCATLKHRLASYGVPPPLPPPRQLPSPGSCPGSGSSRMAVFATGDGDYETLGSVQGFLLADASGRPRRPHEEPSLAGAASAMVAAAAAAAPIAEQPISSIETPVLLSTTRPAPSAQAHAPSFDETRPSLHDAGVQRDDAASKVATDKGDLPALTAQPTGAGDCSDDVDMTVRSGSLQPAVESLWQRHLRRTAGRLHLQHTPNKEAGDKASQFVQDACSVTSSGSGMEDDSLQFDLSSDSSSGSGCINALVPAVTHKVDSNANHQFPLVSDPESASHYAELVLPLESRIYASLDTLDVSKSTIQHLAPAPPLQEPGATAAAVDTGSRPAQSTPPDAAVQVSPIVEPAPLQPRRKRLPLRFRSRSEKRLSLRAGPHAAAGTASTDGSPMRSASQDRGSRTDGEDDNDDVADKGDRRGTLPTHGGYTSSAVTFGPLPGDERSRVASIPQRIVQAFTSRFRPSSRSSAFVPAGDGSSGSSLVSQQPSETFENFYKEWAAVSRAGAKAKVDVGIGGSDCSSPVEQARTVVLTKGRKGFGFVLRGAKADQLKKMGMTHFSPSESMPALQYLDSIDKGSIADKAGLRAGDFILELNGVDVSCLCHEDVVQLIKRSGDVLALKVITLSMQRPSGPPPSGGLQTAAVSTQPAASVVATRSSRAGASGREVVLPTEQLMELSATSMQISGAGHESAKEEESQVLEQLDDTLANYDSQSTGSSSTNAGSDAAATVTNSSACTRPPPPSVLLRSQSGGSGGGSSSAAVGPLQSSQKVASIRARPASRLITAAAELEGMFSASWQSGSSGGSGASLAQSVSHAVVPPPPPASPAPPLHRQPSPAAGTRSAALVMAPAAAAATALASDGGGCRDQVTATKTASASGHPDANQVPGNAAALAGKSTLEIVPLVLESTGSFSIGKGSDFNTFRGPVPAPQAEGRHSSNHSNHRLSRLPVSASSQASLETGNSDDHPCSDEALETSPSSQVGIGGDTGQMHSAPLVRRHMSHPAAPSNSAVRGDLHRSSSAAAVDTLNPASGMVYSAVTANMAADDLSGSQNSMNSSGSTSSFADAIRKAAAAVRLGSPASSPASEHAYPGFHTVSAASQKPAPPSRSSVPSSKESGGDLRDQTARSSSISSLSNSSTTAAAGGSSSGNSRDANKARTSGSGNMPGLGDGQGMIASGNKGAGVATTLVSVQHHANTTATGSQERSGSDNDAGAGRSSALPVTDTATAQSVKGLRSAFEVNSATRAPSTGTNGKSLPAIAGGSSGAQWHLHPRADRAGSAAATAVPASESPKKPSPPPPPVKRVLVKTEHIQRSEDSAAAAVPVLIPPPAMFHSSPPLPPYSSGKLPTAAQQPQQSMENRAEAVPQQRSSSAGDGMSLPPAGARRSNPSTSAAAVATPAVVPSPTGYVPGPTVVLGSSSSGDVIPDAASNHHHHGRHHRKSEPVSLALQQQQQSTVASGIKSSSGVGVDDRSQHSSANGGSSSSSSSSWRPFKAKHVEMWTVDDVADWLDSVGLSEYRHTFVDNCIEGEALVNLTRSEFKELGIDKVGHRVKFEREVLKLMAVSSV